MIECCLNRVRRRLSHEGPWVCHDHAHCDCRVCHVACGALGVRPPVLQWQCVLSNEPVSAARRPRRITNNKVVRGSTDLCRSVYVGPRPGTNGKTVWLWVVACRLSHSL
jgi:hypothetical protein